MPMTSLRCCSSVMANSTTCGRTKPLAPPADCRGLTNLLRSLPRGESRMVALLAIGRSVDWCPRGDDCRGLTNLRSLPRGESRMVALLVIGRSVDWCPRGDGCVEGG
eukprot:169101-Prymnesium_polylepis.1